VNLVVSPYHLTTREPPAMAALALGRRVITVLPGATGDTARGVPAFERFMRSWKWTVPLWRAGVLATTLDGQSPERDIADAARYIRADASCVLLRRFLHEHDEGDPAALTALANDLMKGGPNPGISLPVAAGLDRFGARTGSIVARSAAVSLAQRAEASLAEPLASAVVPVFLQATAQRILHYREVLADEVARFGAACERLASCEPSERAAQARDAHVAAGALTHAFERERGELLLGAADDEVRPVEGAVSLALVALPWDAVLASSVRAMGHASGGATASGAELVHANVRGIKVRDALSGLRVAALVIRSVGKSPV
jgi:hypothetical protein